MRRPLLRNPGSPVYSIARHASVEGAFLNPVPRITVALRVMTTRPNEQMSRADRAEPRLDQVWLEKHNFLTRLVFAASQQPELDIYFLGDSITEWWPVLGREVWEAEFGTLRVLNCGLSGDTTQNILYRIENGGFERISPKVVVLLAGINNLAGSPDLQPEKLAGGIRRIISELQSRSPESRILLLSIFPAGDRRDPIRDRIIETNKRLAEFNHNSIVSYLDIYGVFLDAEGNLPAAIAPDGLHLSARGYQLWAEAMRPALWKLLRQEM